MSDQLWIIISAVIVLFVFGVVGYAFWGMKKNNKQPDYRSMYTLGITWIPLGIVFIFFFDNPAFLVMGIVFLVIGLKNKDKWTAEPQLSAEKKGIKVMLLFGLFVLVLVAGYYAFSKKDSHPTNTGLPAVTVTDFTSCMNAGLPVMESYPRQCRYGDQLFVEEIGNELEKSDLIRLDSPRPNQSILSPLTISGEARGTWFFEATFPVTLTNWDGLIIAEGYATAQDEWMTEDFVPFTATLEFDSPVFDGSDAEHFSRRGALILQKDNPSNLPEYDDALEIPIYFE